MTTTKKKNTSIEKKKNNPVNENVFQTGSFDDLAAIDKDDFKAAAEAGNKKEQKRLQLAGKLSDITGRLAQKQKEYKLSLLDSSKDSGALKIDLECLQKEQKINMDIYTQLFGSQSLLLTK